MANPGDLSADDQRIYWVGRVARASGRLEFATGALLTALIDRPPIGELLATGQSFSVTLDQIEAIIGSHPQQRVRPDLDQPVKRALARARGLMVDRNLVIHGVWFSSAVPQRVHLRRRYGRGRFGEWDAAALEALSIEMDACADRVIDLNNEAQGVGPTPFDPDL